MCDFSLKETSKGKCSEEKILLDEGHFITDGFIRDFLINTELSRP